MEIHYRLIGILLMILAIIHFAFPRYFKWAEELKPLSLINRQMMAVHTFFIALMVFLMGLLCATSSTELIETNLGKKVSFGLGIFWSARLFVQFFGYSSELWRGKKFETSMHILFTIFWSYVAVVFLSVYFI